MFPTLTWTGGVEREVQLGWDKCDVSRTYENWIPRFEFGMTTTYFVLPGSIYESTGFDVNTKRVRNLVPIGTFQQHTFICRYDYQETC